jgi:hypothetical protein
MIEELHCKQLAFDFMHSAHHHFEEVKTNWVAAVTCSAGTENRVC